MHKWLGLIGQEAVARVVRVSSIGGGTWGTPPICVVCCHRISRESRIYRRTMALSQCTR